MTYLDLINNFWEQHDQYSLDVKETTLYFYLLRVNNRCRWTNYFNRNNNKIQVDLNISFKALQLARDRLKQIGLIDFATQNGNSTTWYTLLKVQKPKQTIPDTLSETFAGKEGNSAEVLEELNKIKNKTKSKNKKENIINNIPPIVPKGIETVKVDYVEILNLFNEMFAGKLPQVRGLTDKRRSAVRARVSQYGIDSVKEVFDKVIESVFLLGGNDKNWRCDFDWIFKPSNYIKIMEGNYSQTRKKEEKHPFTERLSEMKYEQF